MYIPIMKNRDEELRVSAVCADFFSESMIPMYEIIQDKFLDRFEVDEDTGEFKYELKVGKTGKSRRSKVKLSTREEDIITLKDINERINGKKAFIDFFRFFENEYGNRNFKNIETSFRLSRDFDYYKKRLLQLASFENFIPTISIKKGLEISFYDLSILIKELRLDNVSIALRITADCLDTYSQFIEENIFDKDYVMLDIRENSIYSKELEIEEFTDLNSQGKKILLNSPRKKDTANKDFENLKFTNKIDNIVSQYYLDINLDGFGDFGGLKDDLPTYGGGGRGAALALLYFSTENKFYSVVNKDTSLGVGGYAYVKQEIIKRRHQIDPDDTCLGMKKIDTLKNGTYASWNNVNLTRYIQSQAKNSIRF
ncbi:Uncharacterised protein [Enterococcus casseliflavus]|uniref:hypothetical protein n=1 Tax=Enterococcus casseliflavus TaxID=37734 RepID=UPI000E037B7E|nr:hypothetical protein [Enterococcus casseliflavus]GEB27497.1 hypothetical protein ECA02_05920 [Enterococcus casseliflavus]STP32545.1 Uncharacterised protein [Enterococcus casseliflavus]